MFIFTDFDEAGMYIYNLLNILNVNTQSFVLIKKNLKRDKINFVCPYIHIFAKTSDTVSEINTYTNQ